MGATITIDGVATSGLLTSGGLVGGVAPAVSAMLSNVFANNLNVDLVPTEVGFWDPSTLLQSSGAGFIAASDGVTVPRAGVYFVSGNFMVNRTATGSRMNVAFEVSLDGVSQPYVQSGSDYIRGSQGHNEASTAVPVYRVEAMAGQRISMNRLRIGNAGVVEIQAGLGFMTIRGGCDGVPYPRGGCFGDQRGSCCGGALLLCL